MPERHSACEQRTDVRLFFSAKPAERYQKKTDHLIQIRILHAKDSRNSPPESSPIYSVSIIPLSLWRSGNSACHGDVLKDSAE